ncbi:hypothetical protein Gasu2_26700 [Galdieria sulphuraria]|nr:hypothetical protein Gasu2_26700 [Galdieria sulphuraria]
MRIASKEIPTVIQNYAETLPRRRVQLSDFNNIFTTRCLLYPFLGVFIVRLNSSALSFRHIFCNSQLNGNNNSVLAFLLSYA